MTEPAADIHPLGTACAGAMRAGAALLTLAVVLAALLRFPVVPLALGIGLCSAAVLVAWQPVWLWVIVPAALPVLDLTPWSGRLFWDEFDLMLSLLVAVAWWRGGRVPTPYRDRPLSAAFALVLLSFAISTARALLPWPGLDEDAFANLLGPFNALRILRGALWAALLWALARRQHANGADVFAAFSRGLVLGLLGTVLCILFERASFTQLLDVSDGYRVAGPFSAMHTGGAYVEAFLVTALPFLLVRLGSWGSWGQAWRMVPGGLLLAGTAYSVAVTFSRGGYAAFALALLVLAVCAAHQPGRRSGRLVYGVVSALVVAGVVGPVLMGSFAQSRLADIDRDLRGRESHWARTLARMDHDAASMLLGMGLGRLPAVNLQRSTPQERSASFRLMDEAGQRFLRLGSGKAVYIEQFVDLAPQQTYRLQMRLRVALPGASLGVGLCEKWLVASATCVSAPMALDGRINEWQSVSVAMASADVGAAHAGLARPVKLSFYLNGPVPVDVASVQLLAPDGRALVRNPGFADGMDHWFFTADHHLAWHAKSMPLAIYFDQGVLGLLAMAAILVLGLWRARRAAWQGVPGAAPLLAALLAFTAVGMFDTLIDTPRFLMLWLLLCCFAAASGDRASAEPLRRT